MGISGRQLRFRRWFPCYPTMSCEIAPQGTSSRCALRAPRRPAASLAMTNRSLPILSVPCANRQPTAGRGQPGPYNGRFGTAVPSEGATGAKRPRNDKPLAFTVLSTACISRQHCAGRGQPGPYNGRSSAPPFFFYFSTNARRCQPGGHKFSICHMFSGRAEILSPKRGDVMQSFVCGTRLCFGADAPAASPGCTPSACCSSRTPILPKTARPPAMPRPSPARRSNNSPTSRPIPPLAGGAGVARLQALRPDTVLALGGGSAIDCAKGIAALGGLPVRLVAVPTTSGSGSEVTSFAILTQDGVKHPSWTRPLRPELAILDPAPARGSAPAPHRGIRHGRRFSLCGGSGRTRGQPRDGRAGPQRLPDAAAAAAALVRGRDGRAGDVHLAASMAALAFDNAGLGACHALAHAPRRALPCSPRTPVRHAAAARHRPPRCRGPHPYAALAAACGLPACAA